MATKETSRRVRIFINGKEVENNIKAIAGEFKLLKNQVALATRGSEDYNKKAAELKRVDAILKQHRSEIRSNTKATEKGVKSVKGFALSWKAVGSAIKSAFLPLLALGALRDLFNAFTDTVGTFQSKLADLSAITGLAGEELNDLGEAAKTLSGSVTAEGVIISQSASDILEAFKLVGSAKPELLGNTEALQEVTKEALILNRAAGGELSTTVEDLTTILNSNGLAASESGRVINVLAAASQKGAKEVGFLTQAQKNLGPTAASAGLELENQIAVLEVFGEKGLDAGKAGTQFKNILLTLQQDQSNVTNGQFDFNKAVESLQPIMGDAVALTQQFGKENVTGAQILAQNAGRIDELTAAITGTNTAYDQAATKSNTLEVAQERFGATVDKLFLRFSEGGDLLTTAVNIATSVVEGFGFYLDILGEAIGPVVDQISDLASSFTSSTEEGEGANGMLNLFKTGIVLATAPLRFLISSLGILIAGLKLLVETGKEVANFFGADFQTDVGGAFDGFTSSIGNTLKEAGEIATDAYDAFSGAVEEGTNKTVEKVEKGTEEINEALNTAKERAKKLGLDIAADASLAEINTQIAKAEAAAKRAAGKAKSAADKNTREAEKKKAELDKLISEIEAIQADNDFELETAGLEGADLNQKVDKRAINAKYEALEARAQGNAEIEAQIRELKAQELLEIDQKYDEIRKEISEQKLIDEEEAREQLLSAQTELQEQLGFLEQSEGDRKIGQAERVRDEQLRLAREVFEGKKELNNLEQKINDDFAKNKVKIEKESAEKEKVIQSEKEQAIFQKKVAAVNAGLELTTQALNLIGEITGKQNEFAKTSAIFEIAISSGVAIAQAVKAASGIPFPGNLVAIASSIGVVTNNIKKAKELINGSDTPEVPKFHTGGRYDPLKGKSDELNVIDPASGELQAKLQRGEFITRNEAVTSETLPLLRAINNSRGQLRNIPQLNTAGINSGFTFEKLGVNNALERNEQLSRLGVNSGVDITALISKIDKWQSTITVKQTQRDIDIYDERVKSVKRLSEF